MVAVSDLIRTVGSAATAIAAVVAVLVYLRSRGTEKRANQIKRADEARKDLREYATDMHTLYAALHDGAVFISAGTAVSDEFFKRAGIDKDLKLFWEALSHDNGSLFLLSSNEGVDKSTQTTELSTVIVRLTAVANQLTGAFAIIRPINALLRAIFSDACSIQIFFNILRVEGEQGTFKRDHGDKARVADVATAFAGHLSSNAALYYKTRYDVAMRTIDQFVLSLSASCITLSDAEVDKLAHAQTPEARAAKTRTDEVKYYLRFFDGTIAPDDVTILNGLVDTIERSVSKEAASAELSTSHTSS